MGLCGKHLTCYNVDALKRKNGNTWFSNFLRFLDIMEPVIDMMLQAQVLATLTWKLKLWWFTQKEKLINAIHEEQEALPWVQKVRSALQPGASFKGVTLLKWQVDFETAYLTTRIGISCTRNWWNCVLKLDTFITGLLMDCRSSGFAGFVWTLELYTFSTTNQHGKQEYSTSYFFFR